MTPDATGRRERLEALRGALVQLRGDAAAAERAATERIEHVDPAHRSAAANLVRYRALRCHDLRNLQVRLSQEGLSSLGRMESDVLRNLDAVLGMLDAAIGDGRSSVPEPGPPDSEPWFELSANAAALLGGTPDDRTTRIMVTLPSDAASDASLVRSFVHAGMNLARVNCAHDQHDAWSAMATHVRSAGEGVRIAMDLGGPKLRTGPIEAGPRVVKIKPSRDAAGRVVSPTTVWTGRAPLHCGDPEVPITDSDWVERRVVGDRVTFREARGRTRTMAVVETTGTGVELVGDRTSYLVPGTILAVGEDATTVGALPATPQSLRVRRGDLLVLTSSLEPAVPTSDGRHRIGCTLPEAFGAVHEGHRVLFDDGKIGGVVTSASEDEIHVSITSAPIRGTKLKAEKGINFPDTTLPIPALTDEDREDLDAVVALADIVEISFVRTADDVRELLGLLEEKDALDIGVVVKLETVAGFEALPEVLLELMRWKRVGVMIARGDLAVEAGFERLAEVQEETLWLCEAARVPVIWATQVLDSLADAGVPTRAEVTDAAQGERAECVMLNKGPYIVEAITALDDILRRMHRHIYKKNPLLRKLGAWDVGE
ncbi:pyruvate kinase [Rhodococcus triatomae]|uniref:pyruvate kinase n=1 Tax=Rhodococcus triatomae TaxID=300028 RepID=A0A1G8SKY8_9NOCA|nr:pyruvate kinase [Rhodococcus triatomae]QNG18696.1 pyruvate kinase [Rhodococcus triatomae]QNG25393.1 pyruvate kinase [Rhodococcus triatomae]SDJ29834.1 pyruvate kinase [Rhodococcus triatomae]